MSDIVADLRAYALDWRARAASIEPVLRAADDIERLRAALKFYANATEEDWHNDNGFNANAALA